MKVCRLHKKDANSLMSTNAEELVLIIYNLLQIQNNDSQIKKSLIRIIISKCRNINNKEHFSVIIFCISENVLKQFILVVIMKFNIF